MLLPVLEVRLALQLPVPIERLMQSVPLSVLEVPPELQLPVLIERLMQSVLLPVPEVFPVLILTIIVIAHDQPREGAIRVHLV